MQKPMKIEQIWLFSLTADFIIIEVVISMLQVQLALETSCLMIWTWNFQLYCLTSFFALQLPGLSLDFTKILEHRMASRSHRLVTRVWTRSASTINVSRPTPCKKNTIIACRYQNQLACLTLWNQFFNSNFYGKQVSATLPLICAACERLQWKQMTTRAALTWPSHTQNLLRVPLLVPSTVHVWLPAGLTVRMPACERVTQCLLP